MLVTGAEGQVGSEIVRLADDEFEVVGFDRLRLDITNARDIERRIGECAPDLLVNCAAYTAVDRAEDEPDLAYRVNAEALGLLGRACGNHGIGIIHLSTDYVFDGTKDRPYVEQDRPNPLNVYGASKLAGEELLRASVPRHLILRVSWVFGRLGRSFVDTILRLATQRQELAVIDDQVGAPSPAVAIARTIRLVSEGVISREDVWGSYHFSTAPALSWCEFAREIIDMAANTGLLTSSPGLKAIGSRDWPAKATRPLNSRLDASKLRETFAIPVPPWRPHLRCYIDTR